MGGGAHSAPFGLAMNSKRQVRASTSTLYQSIKNVRNKMKKIRQTNFYTIIASDYPKM